MRKRLLVLMGVFLIFVPVFAEESNPFVSPERVNPRINVAVQIARLLKQKEYNRIAVVYMQTSDLCAVFAASLVASLKTLGLEAYYIKGGEGLEERLRELKPMHIYMAYFGEKPAQEVQTQFNEDLYRVLTYDQKSSIILQPSLLRLGFLSGIYTDEKLTQLVDGKRMLTFSVEQGKVYPIFVEFRDLEIKVTEESNKKRKQKK
ncbi:hypothetical protein [Hydrogenobacter hydrogenophilus]|uniref:Uncharacterized protein n=1 Tax=Hydrogenobacter hydrogenophilus TaxID=35835 RepID=A0A285NUF6_9AQUI|nr:hypothetical protein [Hydrogenobacter hydrogenophilus]SNZ11301.1 hypothetical protein SAMN06265353_0199 [Hydrogenobacter hydrogenophilus]